MSWVTDVLSWLRGKEEEEELPAAMSIGSTPRLPPAPAPEEPPKPAVPAFGVDQAIALMKKLPLDDEPELVLRVVRKTLRSTGVSIEQLVESAKKREDELASSVEGDRNAIEQLEREIAERKASIDRKLAQMKETHEVRTRLQEAIESESKVGPVLVPPAEIARLQAEAMAKSTAAQHDDPAPSPKPPMKPSAPPPPPPSPKPTPRGSTPPPRPVARASTPPPGATSPSTAAPATTAPPVPPKPKTKPPPVPTKKPTTPPKPPAPPAVAAPVEPAKDEAPPKSEDEDDPYQRPTARWLAEEPDDEDASDKSLANKDE